MLTTEEVTSTPPTSLPRQHAVKFFVENNDLYQTLADFVNQAVVDGGSVLIVATPEHWKGLTLYLSANDVLADSGRVDALVERGQLVFVDAREARDELMVKGQPSRARFETLFESLIDQMIDVWSDVHVYDEITDLLAQDSQFGPMRQLEQIWEACRADRAFGMLSGYGLESFAEPADEQPFDNVCRARQQIFAAGESGGLEVAKWQRRTVVLNQRLEQKREELDQTQKELERERERHRTRSDFVGKFAHELRNPLAPMLCAIEMMNLRGDTDSQRERGILERQVSRLVGTVDEFLDAESVLFDAAELQQSRVETHDVVREAIELADAAIEDGDHSLHVDVAPSGLAIEADPKRLAQAIAQMLENAATYTPGGGNIWLEAHPEAGSVAISVRDDGPGVDASHLEDIFEMFVQGDAEAKLECRGIGLGLALVRKVAEAHDGAVAAFSDKDSNNRPSSKAGGVGSEFVMRLPLVPTKGPIPQVSRLRKGEVTAGGRVLVVDDNEDFASTLSETLDLLGHDVRHAHDANEALAMLADFWPDVALLDINLPGMTGHELAERINEHSKARGRSRLVAVTGYSDERKRKRSEEIGFDAHLVKPIVLSQLQETLDSVLGD